MRVNDVVITALGRKDLIAPRENKILRRDGAHGVVQGVLGRKNQLVLVMHEEGSAPAIYFPDELQIEPNAYWKIIYQQHGLSYFVEVPTYEDVRAMLDVLEDDGVKSTAVEGPFYSDKELTEGLITNRSLFDRLKND
jgi:hypothetical protein